MPLVIAIGGCGALKRFSPVGGAANGICRWIKTSVTHQRVRGPTHLSPVAYVVCRRITPLKCSIIQFCEKLLARNERKDEHTCDD